MTHNYKSNSINNVTDTFYKRITKNKRKMKIEMIIIRVQSKCLIQYKKEISISFFVVIIICLKEMPSLKGVNLTQRMTLSV